MDAGVKARCFFLCEMILFTSLGDSSAGAIPSTCFIPHVKEGGNASVTCMFTENISVKKSDFQIDRYSSINGKQETLLACTWIIDKPKCYMHPRISFDSVITTTFEIQIPHVTSVDAGKYICYVLPSPNGITNSCNLTLEETTFFSETYTTKYQIPRSYDIPMTDIPTSIQDSKENGMISASVIGVISGVNIAFFILQGICFVAAFKYIKRRLRDGIAAKDKNSNLTHILDIKPKTDEVKANTLCVQQEEDTIDEENKTVSCILTSKSEGQPTDLGFPQYEENGTTVGDEMTEISNDDSTSETGLFTDSGVSIYQVKESGRRDVMSECRHPWYTSERKQLNDTVIALLKENGTTVGDEMTEISNDDSTSETGLFTDSGVSIYQVNAINADEYTTEYRFERRKSEIGQCTGSVNSLYQGKGTGGEDRSESRLLSSTSERDHPVNSVTTFLKVKESGRRDVMSERRLPWYTSEREQLNDSVIALPKVEYIRNWRNKYSPCASKQ